MILLLLAPPAPTAVVSGVLRYPSRFAEVVPSGLYRGGYPTRAQVDHLADDFKIRTILNLTTVTQDHREREEAAAAARHGVEVVRVSMPGNGCAEFEALDRAAAVLADQSRWPIFFHCVAGKQRSNAVLAAYRMKYGGWSLDRALRELDAHGLDRTAEKALCDHLEAYSRTIRQRAP